VLQYIAERSESLLLWAISKVAFFTLIAFCMASMPFWKVQIFHPWHRYRWVAAVDSGIHVLVVGLVVVLLIFGIPRAVHTIALMQAR
jgi:hypothetical protein